MWVENLQKCVQCIEQKLQVVHNVKMGVVGNWEKKGQKLSAVQRGREGGDPTRVMGEREREEEFKT